MADSGLNICEEHIPVLLSLPPLPPFPDPPFPSLLLFPLPVLFAIGVAKRRRRSVFNHTATVSAQYQTEVILHRLPVEYQVTPTGAGVAGGPVGPVEYQTTPVRMPAFPGHAKKCHQRLQRPQTTSEELPLFSLLALLCAPVPADMDSS